MSRYTEGYNSLSINGHQPYYLLSKIGNGSFGQVFEALNLASGKLVAAKIESIHSKSKILLHEAKMYHMLQGGPGIPKLHSYCSLTRCNILLLDLLGPNLSELFYRCNQRFSLKTILMLADQMLTSLEYIHDCNIIHRDLKPNNMLMAIGCNSSKLYIIDFGLSTYYKDPYTGIHIKFSNYELVGNAIFASMYATLGWRQSRRDDLESVAYILLYFLNGYLPWQKFWNNHAELVRTKLSTSIKVMSKKKPKEFVSFFIKCRILGYEERPTYEKLRASFRGLFKSLNYFYDGKYDWN